MTTLGDFNFMSHSYEKAALLITHYSLLITQDYLSLSTIKKPVATLEITGAITRT